MKVVYFAATLFVLLIVCDASDEPKCKQGESYEKDCNTCHCTDTGVEVCTERACVNIQQHPDTEPLEEHTEIPETNGQVCVPNETKMQDCNRCKCSANGIVWICTRRLCPATPAPKIPVNEPGFTCVPNQVFKDDCNTCSCDESGTLARCTAMACDPSERQRRHIVATTTELPLMRGNQCIPGTRWKNDCNQCWCSDNGFAACTLKGCLGHGHKLHHRLHPAAAVLETSEATPTNKLNVLVNRVRKQTSNQTKTKYTSPDNGFKPPPTKNVPAIVITPAEGAAIENSPTRPDYGTTSGVTYTEAQLLDPNFSCEPSSSFKVECNTCWCAASGKKVRYCTRQACHPKVYPTLAPPK